MNIDNRSALLHRSSAAPELFAALLKQFRDEGRPSGLMARAQPRASLAMKLLVKENQIPPPGVC